MANTKAEVVLEWGSGQHLFSLKGAEIEELEAVCGRIGLGAIYQRVVFGTWFWGDLYHTIRLGLIGGGMGAVEAKRLTDFYIKQPLAGGPNCPEAVAKAVLGAVIEGLPAPGEAGAGETPAT